MRRCSASMGKLNYANRCWLFSQGVLPKCLLFGVLWCRPLRKRNTVRSTQAGTGLRQGAMLEVTLLKLSKHSFVKMPASAPQG